MPTTKAGTRPASPKFRVFNHLPALGLARAPNYRESLRTAGGGAVRGAPFYLKSEFGTELTFREA
jgi:hypothetical protein